MNDLNLKTDNILKLCFAIIIFSLSLTLLYAIRPVFMPLILLTVILRLMVISVFGFYRIKRFLLFWGKEVVGLSMIFGTLVLSDILNEYFLFNVFSFWTIGFSVLFKFLLATIPYVVLLGILLKVLYPLNLRTWIILTVILSFFFGFILPGISFIVVIIMLGRNL